jgi:hypothetical protein
MFQASTSVAAPVLYYNVFNGIMLQQVMIYIYIYIICYNTTVALLPDEKYHAFVRKILIIAERLAPMVVLHTSCSSL